VDWFTAWDSGIGCTLQPFRETRPRLSPAQEIIEVRGCFWHQDGKCIDSHIPKARPDYWLPKLQRNQSRDAANLRSLKALGFRVYVVWECETKNERRLVAKLGRFLDPLIHLALVPAHSIPSNCRILAVGSSGQRDFLEGSKRFLSI
jgi:hypothetical protein